MIVGVTEQLLDRKPMLDCLRRKACFPLCQMLLRPGEEGRKARRWFSRNFRREHDDEPAESIEFINLGWDRVRSGGSTILNVLDARCPLAPRALLFYKANSARITFRALIVEGWACAVQHID